MTSQQVEPVRKELELPVSSTSAWKLFTERMADWWPKTHKIGTAELKKGLLETKVGGRWYEVDADESEHNWGKVLTWEPPKKLVLAWQISASWQYDPSFSTPVEITFVDQGAKQSRLKLTHREIEKYGAKAEDVRKSFDSEHGWIAILNAFLKFVESQRLG